MDTLNDDSRPCLNDQNNTEHYSKYLELINNCNESDPLLSETPLGRCLEQIQLAQVPPADLIKLSQALNVEQLIPTQNGPPRDYRGLSELMGFSSVELEARFKRSHNPAKSLIEAYVQKIRFQRQHDGPKEANLNELLKFLETLERFDIIDDSLPTLIKLAQQHQHFQACANIGQNHIAIGPFNSLEIDRQRPVQYDAFVCFAPEDEAHARELIYILEEHNKRIFTMDHLLPGQLEFDALVQIITSDCHKVIIVLTPNFFRSRECDFQAKFATELDIKSGWSAKIIPVKCEHVDDSQLPPLIRVLSKIDMTRGSYGREWQLRRLLNSLVRDSPKADHSQNHGTPLNRQHFRTHRKSDSCETAEREFDPHHLSSPQPIIDLAYSQSSDSALDLGTQLSIMTSNNDQPHQDNLSVSRISSPLASTSGFFLDPQTASSCASTNQLDPWYKRKNWYQKIKRSFRDTSSKSSCGSNSPSTSSQIQLVPQESGDEKN